MPKAKILTVYKTQKISKEYTKIVKVHKICWLKWSLKMLYLMHRIFMVILSKFKVMILRFPVGIVSIKIKLNQCSEK